MERKEKKNKLQHAFDFEDLYKEEDSELENSNNNLYELNPVDKEKHFLKSSTKTSDYDYEKKLTKNSKYELITRIILFSLGIIFIPLSLMVTNSFDKIEIMLVFKNTNDLISKEILSDNSFNNIFYVFKIIKNKDFMLGIASVLYILFHPYITLKIVFSSGILYYILIIMKCINQSKRPLWEKIIDNEINDIIACETSFSSPSEGIFFITLYFIYPIFCIKTFYSKDTKMNIVLKILFFLIYLALSLFEYFYLLLYKLNYIHEIIFTNMLTLISICILIDFDKKIQKKFSNSTKNIFKTRKNKLKFFIYVFILFFSGVLLYNFILPNKVLLEVIDILSMNKSCSQKEIETLGMKGTFLNLPYIFSMIGAFWGACLTIEYNPGEWWYQPLIIDKSEKDKIKKNRYVIEGNKTSCFEIFLLILKSIIMIIVYSSLWFGFSKIPYITFEFNLVIEGIKYFLVTFVCFGIVPIFFGLLNMNKKVGDIYDDLDDSIIEVKEDWSKNLFTATLFINYQEKARYPYIHLKRH